MWTQRHLLGIEQLSDREILHAMDRAERHFMALRNGPSRSDSLRGRTVLLLFAEASTRTRTSFEIAAKRLGADVINVSQSSSSMTKGETLLDTIRNLEAMHTDIVVLRHSASGAASFVAGRTGSSVINAGDGEHEHPTQALLDAVTLKRRWGTLEGRTIVICGDIARSRVARSNVHLMTRLGAHVRLCSPHTMRPRGIHHLSNVGPPVQVFEHLGQAVEGADAILMLRIQSERTAGALMASAAEYARTFGLSPALLRRARADAVVLHPGPINRGVELETSLADGAQSLILEQVETGVAVRMAILELVANARVGLGSHRDAQ